MSQTRGFSEQQLEQGTEHANSTRVSQTTVLPLYNNHPNDNDAGIEKKSTLKYDLQSENVRGKENQIVVTQDVKVAEKASFYQTYRIFIHLGLFLLILAWWISGLVLKATRHRWIQSTIFAWFFMLLLVSRHIPFSPLGAPIGKVWHAVLGKPFWALPYIVRLNLGILCLAALVLGTAFGVPLKTGSTYADRARCLFGLVVFQIGFAITSVSIRKVQWDTVIVGLGFQQILALLVFKTGAGFSFFNWIAQLAQDFLGCAQAGASFFFGEDLANQHLFFISTLAAIIFFIAFVQTLYYIGAMQWVIGKFAWFFFKTLRISGAESVVAASSPFIGQGESACLVRPYVAMMTPSEIHQTMTSGFATIAGSVLSAYVSFGMPASYLVTSAVMSIPASIAISKLRYPEIGDPLTKGKVVVVTENDEAVNTLHAFSNGAWFGLRVAGMILANVATILSLVAAIDGLLTWVGKSFGIHHLTLELIFSYVFYPLAWLIGVPKGELLLVSRLIGTKLIANEFVAYQGLQKLIPILSQRAFTIAVFSLCGFANLSSLGIQIGVLSSLADNQKKVIARVGPSALICGFIATLQTAAIAGMLV